MSDWIRCVEPWVGKEALWQHTSNPSWFSVDQGQTYYDLNESLDPEGNPRNHRIENASA